MNYSLYFILLHFLCFNTLAEKLVRTADRPIKILNWWNYIDPRVSNKIKDNNFKTEITTYRSNEVALARLLTNKDNFDVAIISNTNVEILAKAGLLNAKIAKKVRNERNYLDLMPNTQQCVPYLWGSTIFSYDSRTNPKAPRSLEQLNQLKAEGFKVGYLDEPLEMVTRIVGDRLDKCSKKSLGDIFSMLTICHETSLENIKFSISSNDFLTSYDEFIKGEKVASYGWQGSVFLNLKNAPWIKFNIAENYPVIGGDFVCILKNKEKDDSRNTEIENFVKLLTDKESTGLNTEVSQYFSPYENDTKFLQPKILELHEELINKAKNKNAIVISTPNEKELSIINKWWKKVRYHAQ